MHVYNRCVMAAFCGPWLLESNLLWMICIFFWNLYLDSTSKEGRRLRLAPPEGMHALHREREGHLFLGLQFPPCCWVRWVIFGGLFDLEISHTHTHPHTRTRTHTHARTHAHTRTHTRAYARAHTYTHTHTHTLTHLWSIREAAILAIDARQSSGWCWV